MVTTSKPPNSHLTLSIDFCPACGRGSDYADCPVSHDDTAPSQGVGIGRVVTYRRLGRRRTAVVVGHSDEGPIVVENTDSRERTPNKVTDAPDWDDIMSIASPLYRLETLAGWDEWSTSLSSWLTDHRQSVLRTIGDRRSYALQAVSAGETALIPHSGLGDAELAWLSMHAHRDAGHTQMTFEMALSLAPDAYPDHVLVLVECVSQQPELLHDGKLWRHIAGVPGGTRGKDLLMVLSGRGSIEIFASATSECGLITGRSCKSRADMIIFNRGSLGLNTWTRAATSDRVSLADLEQIRLKFPSIADDLIDNGRVDSSDVASVQSVYLRARLDVSTVGSDDLAVVGAEDEIARRAYTSGDRQKLETLAEHNDDAKRLLILDSLRRGDIPDDLPDDKVIHAVAASLRSGKAHPNALEDASAWSVISDLIADEDVSGYPAQAPTWQLERAFQDLAMWDFESALGRAKAALKWSEDEAVRDEALNVIAFALFQQGHDEQAIAALEKALEGEYSANLQANIGIVATDLHPDVAAHHLARLAHDAPSLELKLAAVRHAFNIWTTSADAWDEDGLVMPDDLVRTFRGLVVADIPHDDYVNLVQLLSRADSEWLAQAKNTDSGPNAVSDARKVYVGKASHDPSEFVDALVAASKSSPNEEWFIEERDQFVESLRSLMFSDGDTIGPASYAFAAIDAGLQLNAFDYVTLACGSALSIFQSIHEDEALPSDSVVAMIRRMNLRFNALDSDDQERLRSLVDLAGKRYGIVVLSFYAKAHDSILEALRNMSSQIYGMPRHRINWYVVEDALKPMQKMAYESARDVRAAKPLVRGDDIRGSLDDLASALDELKSKLAKPRSLF